MDFYRQLIADQSKRYSLEVNNLVEFIFNDSIQHLQREPQFYSELAKVVLTDQITNNVQDGSFELFNSELTVRVNKFQGVRHFDKYTIMIKLSDEFFDHEQLLHDELDELLID